LNFGRSTLPENGVLPFRPWTGGKGRFSRPFLPCGITQNHSESTMQTASSSPGEPLDTAIRQHILILPVAARASARPRFASLQPTAGTAIAPQQALVRLEEGLRQGEIAGIELAGPGDPLATIDVSLATLRLIAENHPGLRLSILTLGIGGEQWAGELRQAGLREVRIQVDAVDPVYLEKIYAWIRPGTKTLPLPEAARILVDEQLRAVSACKKAGITVQVITTVYPDHNTDHLEAIARTMAACGADGMILIPYQPAEGADIALPAADTAMMTAAGRACARHLPVSTDNRQSPAGMPQTDPAPTRPQPTRQRPNVAVASANGLDVDLHLGQARQLLIYGPRGDGLVCLLETRPAPEPGGAGKRWQRLAEKLADCFALLAASAGERPRGELAEAGIAVLVTEDSIEGIVDVLYGGGKKGKQCRK
jgi:nitrogen fixation protein NifB